MNKSVRRVGFGAVVGLMSAGTWLACSSSAPPPAGILDAGGGGAKDAAASDTGSGGASDASTSSASSSSGTASSSSGGSSSSGTGSSSSASSTGSSTSSSGSSGGGNGDSGLDAGPASDGGTTDDASDGGLPDGGAITCQGYCTLIQQVCTGPNAQYPAGTAGMTACMSACQTFDTTNAATGDTLLCHYEHAVNAMTATHPHCWHAGPYGWGVCGSQCQDFCQIATSYCTAQGGYTGDAAPYSDLAACTAACPGFASVATTSNGIVDGGFNAAGPTSGNTRDCREYHLGAALQSTTLQQIHCPHVAATSSTCF